jgi:hypothetical protein
MTDYNHDPLVPRCGLTADLAAATAYPNELLWTTDTKNLYVEQGGSKILVGGSIGVPHNVLSASHLDSTPAACVRGDIIIGSGVNPLWTRLAVGAAGTYLAGGTEPAWATLNQAAVAGLTTASSPVFVTVKCSGLTDSYIPYHVSDAVGLANSYLNYTSSGNVFTHVNVGASGPNWRLDTVGGGGHGVYDLRFANLSGENLSAVTSIDELGALSARGYGATSYSGSATAAIRFMSTENWTDSAYGTIIDFTITKIGTTTPSTVAKWLPNGTFQFNGVDAGSPVASGTTQTYGLLRLKPNNTTAVLDFGAGAGILFY